MTMPDSIRRLRMFAGPNGSGKTSLIRRMAREFSATGLFHIHRLVNADDIYAQLRAGQAVSLKEYGIVSSEQEMRSYLQNSGRLPPNHPALASLRVADARVGVEPESCDAYVAATIGDFLRDRMLDAGLSFAFETVMSHPNKVDFFARARAAGYRTYLYFIATNLPDLNAHRVQSRVELGGHPVPRDKVIERYARCMSLLGRAMSLAHRAFLFDNSGEDPVWLAQVLPDGRLELETPGSALPHWFHTWAIPAHRA